LFLKHTDTKNAVFGGSRQIPRMAVIGRNK